MASVADTLITRYQLQDDYSAKLKKMSAETDKFGQSVQGLAGAGGGGAGGSLGGLVSGLGSISTMAPGIGTAAAAIAASIAAIGAATVTATLEATKFGWSLMRIAAPYDTLERTFQGIYGNAKDAAQMMAYLNQEANKGNFAFKDLANAAKLLALSDIQFGEFNTAMQAIALRGSGSPAQNLEMVASALTKIKAGDIGEAFETLRSFGIGKDELRSLGATFDKSGQFTGNIQQALDLFKKVGEEGRGVVEAMNGGMEQWFSNFDAYLEQMQIQAGKALFSNLKPVLDNLLKAMVDILDSGIIKDTVNAITSLLDIDPSSDGLAKLAISVLAAIRASVVLIRSLWEGIIQIVNRAITVARILSPLGAKALESSIGNPFGGLATDVAGVYRDSFNEMWNTYQASQSMKAKKPPVTEPLLKGAKDAIKESVNELANKMDKPSSPLPQIARHTKQTAENTKAAIDMTRHILGGGDIGRLGLSPAELQGFGGGRTRGRQAVVKVRVIGGEFSQIIQDIINQTLPQLRRQGAI